MFLDIENQHISKILKHHVILMTRVMAAENSASPSQEWIISQYYYINCIFPLYGKSIQPFAPFGLLLLAVPQLCSSLFMYKTEIKARLLMPYLVHSLQHVTEPDHSVSSEYMQELKPPQVWWECWYTLSKWNANKSLISKALKFPAYHPASSRAFKHLYNQSSYLCFLNNANHWHFLYLFFIRLHFYIIYFK